MDKEKIIDLFKRLSPEEKFEIVKTIMPEFCKSMRNDPQRLQEMMKNMMGFMGKEMGNWMGMMNFEKKAEK
jgi:hypothetical protein